jgi:hypothetical protein
MNLSQNSKRFSVASRLRVNLVVAALIMLIPTIAARGQSYNNDAISREVSIYNGGIYTVDSISREVSVFNDGFNQLYVTIGQTVAPVGTVGTVPITVSLAVPSPSLQIAVNFPSNLLTSWSNIAQAPLTGTTTVSDSNVVYFTYNSPDGGAISNLTSLGQISFIPSTNQPSGFLPLTVAGGAVSTGGPFFDADTTGSNGQVVVLNKNPIFAWNFNTNALDLTLYGYTGTNYTIEEATNLVPPVDWQPDFFITPVDYISVISNIVTTNPLTVFRASQ